MSAAEKHHEKNGGAWLRQWWPIILFVLTIMLTVGTYTAQFTELRAEVVRNTTARESWTVVARDVDLLQRQMEKTELLLSSHEQSFSAIQVQLAEIQKDLAYIRLSIDRMEKR